MGTWVKWIAVALGGLLFLYLLLAAVGAWRWSAGTRALVDRLEAARRPVSASRFAASRDLDGLPPPVQRFFRAALVDGTPVVESVHLEHSGTFNLAAEGADRWTAFTSIQQVTTRRPGFVWDARMTMTPGLTVRVHDAYVAGEGILHPALLGLFSLANLHDASKEPGGLAHGELIRWMAEAAWYPTALLPSQGARWTAVDEQSAQVTLADDGVEVSLLVRFDPATGLIDSVRSETRGRTVGQRVITTPWEGHWWGYQERSGMKVPMNGEVAWLTAEGKRVYWRGTVTALAYEAGR